MTKKITKRDRFNQLLAIAEVAHNPELVEFIEHEIELLASKNATKGETKTQKENLALKETIVAELAKTGKAVTISELQAESEVMDSYSNQKLSALLRQLVADGLVEKATVKGKTYFKAN